MTGFQDFLPGRLTCAISIAVALISCQCVGVGFETAP